MRQVLQKPLMFVLSLLVAATGARAATIVLDPTDDGALYVCAGCNPDPLSHDYLLVAGYIQGDTHFATPTLRQHVHSAVFTVNPYAEPLFGPHIQIFGYGTNSASLTQADFGAGTLIGTLTLPATLGYGADAAFDVTSFVKPFLSGNHANYIGFRLVSDGTDVFSSKYYNYGHSEQLTISYGVVPDAATWSLLMCGFAGLGLVQRRQRHAGQRRGA